MKEKFKKVIKMFAVCFMAVLSCFTIFGCKNTPPEDPDKDVGSTTLNAEEKYTELKGRVATTTPVNGYTMTQKELISMEYGEVDYSECDFSAMGMTTEEEINDFKASMSENLEDDTIEYKTIFAYDATSKNGAKINYRGESLNKYEVSQGNTLYVWNYVEDSSRVMETPREKFNIDENYYNQYYKYFNETFDDMAEDIVRDSLDDVKEYMNTNFGMIGIDPAQTTINWNVACEENNGLLEIVLTFTLNNLEELDMGETLMSNVDMTGNITLKSDATSIREISTSIQISGTMSMNLSEMLDAEGGEEDAPSLIISIPVDITEAVSLNISAFDSSVIPTFDPSEFVGFGSDGEAQNRDIKIDLNLVKDGKAYDLSGLWAPSSKMGDSLSVNQNGGKINNHENIKWYTDVACTQEFTGTLPSYDITLYAKFEDFELKENNAFVIRVYTSDEYNSSNVEMYLEDIGAVVDSTENTVSDSYKYAYVNGVKYESGDSYTLDATKINIVYFVYADQE